MAEKQILGVDFSGAETNNTTWVTEAALQDKTLSVKCCYRPSRKRKEAYCILEKRLLEMSPAAVVALDFPFSVPRRFAEEFVRNPSSMPDVWGAVANKEYKDLDGLRRRFVERHGEMIRRGDAHFGGPFSPLKAVNPDMLPMTFHGMQMLSRLWESDKGFRIPPLDTVRRNGPTLMETMPGVLLRGFGLPARNYKTRNQSNSNRPEDKREEILMGLEKKFGNSLRIPAECRSKCLKNPDCLDSLVAAIGAALWAKDKSKFLCPRESIDSNEEINAARLEGWIYAPRPQPLS